MRLDHLLSREKARVETPKLIPRSMPMPAMVLVKQRTVRFKMIALTYKYRSVSFSGFVQYEIRGGLAQLGERLPCKQEVSGSIPLISTTSMDC